MSSRDHKKKLNLLIEFSISIFIQYDFKVYTNSPVDTERKLGLQNTFNLRPVSTGRLVLNLLSK